MSGNKTVEVLCLNGRRQKVKTLPGSSILQILQEVCRKQGYNEAEVDLIYHRKVLDISTTMRYTNIPNNAKLEMVTRSAPRKAANVKVALQTDFDERLQHDFIPSMTLYEILEHWEKQSEGKYEGKIICKVPVIIYMTQEISGIDSLQKTTLESLGLLGGNIVLRLVHKEQEVNVPCITSKDSADTGRSVEHKKAESSVYIHDQGQSSLATADNKTSSKQEVEVSSSPTSENCVISSLPTEGSVEPSQKRQKLLEEGVSKTEFSPDVTAVSDASHNQQLQTLTESVRPFQQFKFPHTAAEGVEEIEAVDPQKILAEERLTVPCQREAAVFNLTHIETINRQISDDDESFYDVTVEDIRMRIHSLKTEASEETPLMTKNMRRTKEIEKAMRYKKVIIRIQFPDKFVLQGVFRPLEPIEAVRQFVKEHLQGSGQNFYLYTTPPKCELKDEKQTIYQAKLAPAALVHVSSKQNMELVLRKELIEKAVSYLEAEGKAFDILRSRHSNRAVSLPSTKPAIQPISGSHETVPKQQQQRPAASGFMPSKTTGNSAKVPKWFR